MLPDSDEQIAADLTERLAVQLRGAADSGSAIPPIRNFLAKGDVVGAYEIQEHNTRHWIAQGRRLVGRKIGLTSKSVQKQLGVDEPDFGMLFADMAVTDGEEIAFSRLMQPKVEAEVALVLGRSLNFERHTVADLIAATDYALPAIEVVGSRISNWDIHLVDTIADNASSSLFVLGTRPCRLTDIDLIGCTMTMQRRGEEISAGSGADCLGNPLNAAIWLANMMARVGRPLQAGDIVLTGALGPMVAVQPGDVIEARIAGLGSVRACFGNQ